MRFTFTLLVLFSALVLVTPSFGEQPAEKNTTFAIELKGKIVGYFEDVESPGTYEGVAHYRYAPSGSSR